MERAELVTPEPALALAGLLGVTAPDLEAGLPLMWHWLYTLERPAQADLGADGHPVRGVVPEPPGPGRRRMWAGGRVETIAPLVVGLPVTRRTRVLDQIEKEGRTGRLTFVEVGHEMWQRDRLVVRERQDIVYRDAVDSEPRAVRAEATVQAPLAAGEWKVEITPSLLFRFSALTYNAHRIHYDRPYATQVEGYPGLVTHGPLQALCMAEVVRGSGRDTSVRARLEYRLVAPLFEDQGLVAHADPRAGEQVGGGVAVGVRDLAGRTTARGRLTLIPPAP